MPQSIYSCSRVKNLEPTASIEGSDVDVKVGPSVPTPKTASQKKLESKRRLELGPSSGLSQGPGHSNAYLTSEIDT